LKSPEISVIMSAHNERRYIGTALESLLNQSMADFEVIIIDDASADGTAELIEKFRDSRIRVFRKNKNAGLTANLNFAASHARSGLLARMDADDVSEPRRFEMQLKALNENPEIAFMGSRCYLIDANGRTLGILGRKIGPEEFCDEIRLSNLFVHGSVIIRKSAFNDVGGYRTAFRFSQDYDLWLRLCEKHKGACLENIFYCWRMHKGAVSSLRRITQLQYSELARKLAAERSKFGNEITDLDAAAHDIESGRGRVGFKRVYVNEQIIWARTLYASGAFKSAANVLLALLKQAPANPAIWKMVWEKYGRFTFHWLKVKLQRTDADKGYE